MRLAADQLEATWWGANSCLLLRAGWFFLLALQPSLASAQGVDVRNTNFRQEGTKIVVTYDLLGEEGEEYDANLLLSTSGGAAFDYEPKAVRGDVGEGIRPGSGKTIRWRVLEDFPDGLRSPNVQFKVTVVEEGGNTWLYVLGSAIVAGGGGTAAAFLTGLIGGTDGGGGSEPTPIPPPDGPPQ